MAGPRINMMGAFPGLEAAMAETMAMFPQPLHRQRRRTGARASPRSDILLSFARRHDTDSHRRLHVSRAKAKDFVTQTCGMLFKGLR